MNSREPSTQEFTRFLFARQPVAIRERLVKIPKIERALGLSSRFVVNIAGLGSADALRLFETVRSVFENRVPQTLDCHGGGSLEVTLESGEVIIRKVGEEASSAPIARLRELMLLSPDGQQREAVLREVMTRLSVAIPPGLYSLDATIRSSPLGEKEIVALFQELSEGVSTLQARALESMQKGQPQLHDLVPDSIDYYKWFCGPLPHETGPDDYIKGPLTNYRQELLKRDLAKGLDICVLGGLAVELSPAQWTNVVNNDDLWDAIQSINPWRDPYSLLGALDVALDRMEDSRFSGLARDAAEKLVAPTFQCGKGHDGLELLPIFATLVLNRINDAEELNLCPPYWKRMCAWMHGGILLRITQDYELNLEQLKMWVDHCQSVASVLTRCRDLRLEPLFRATEMSKRALAAEVIGRLHLMIERNPNAAAAAGLPRLVNEAQERISENDPKGWNTPGPLEGHKLPRERAIELSENDVAESLTMIENNTIEHTWFVLSKISQLCDLTSLVLRKAADRTSALVVQAKDGKLSLNTLAYAAVVAAAHRDVQLASAVATAAGTLLHIASDEEDVSSALQVVLMAGAANAVESVCAVWLEEHLANLAGAVQRGSHSTRLLVLIRQLRSVLPLRYSIVDRAEAIASAAF